ncbi:MAG: tetratricopeptide repeat protein [Gemmatimonadota bacterium]
MANLDKFKEAARKFEQKEQWSKAIEQYLKAVEAMEKSPEDDTDPSLYNRVGDLYQKAADTQNAIAFYERAADKYGEGGFHNNAIALCNKIIRLAPGRSQVYLKLGQMFAAKGFTAEAKQNLIEYADRMQKAGQLEEAFKALKAFAQMTPGQDDIWAVLAAQARAAAKTDEQKEQVEKLLGEFEQKDRVATQRKSRMSRHMITGEDLPPEPKGKKDLVFLDLGETPSPRKSAARPAPTIEELPVEAAPPALEIESTALTGGEEPAPMGSALDLEPTSFAEAPPSDAGATLELEPTSLGAEPPAVEARAPATEEPGLLDLEMPEPEVAAEQPSAQEAVEGLPLIGAEEPAAADAMAGLPMLEMEEGAPPAEAAAPSLEFLDLGEVKAEVPTVQDLESKIAAKPDDWDAHRRLGEVLLEEGQRDRGIEELNQALDGFDQAAELESAFAVTEEILRLDTNSIRHQQKRVELAYRLNDRSRLVDAYNELADALLRSNDPGKAVAVYQRVLEHDPANARAKAAIDTLAPPAPPAGVAAAPAAPAAPVPAAAAAGDFVDLGAMLLEDEGPMDTRMRMEDEAPTGDEDQDFQTMLQAFKKGIAANVGEEDFQSHYDLGVAYKEMGLLDEAIGEFQKALRATDGRLKTSEALGMCFYDKGQFAVTETILRRGLEIPGASDADRIGVLYWLGRAQEEQGKAQDALASYNRVFAVDINFQDVRQRVNALHQKGA